MRDGVLDNGNNLNSINTFPTILSSRTIDCLIIRDYFITDAVSRVLDPQPFTFEYSLLFNDFALFSNLFF